jgi:hypothetical protein
VTGARDCVGAERAREWEHRTCLEVIESIV